MRNRRVNDYCTQFFFFFSGRRYLLFSDSRVEPSEWLLCHLLQLLGHVYVCSRITPLIRVELFKTSTVEPLITDTLINEHLQ
jgi:hypothetical protein